MDSSRRSFFAKLAAIVGSPVALKLTKILPPELPAGVLCDQTGQGSIIFMESPTLVGLSL